MSLLSSQGAAPLLSLSVYCPLLCQDKEERAQDNILFFHPAHTDPNRQMNHVGFCIAMSSLAPRFGVQHSTRQTIRKQRSNICLYSPIDDLWASAHVRGGYGGAEAAHQLLRLSFALFELLYGRAVLRQLSTMPNESDDTNAASDASSTTLSTTTRSFADAQAVLQSFFSKCAAFIFEVLAAQQRVLGGTASAAAVPLRPSPSMTATQWAQYLCAEASMGFPLHYVNEHELPRRQLGEVEDVVQRVLWPRAWAQVDALHSPEELPRYCVFCLPSMYVLAADGRLTCRELQAIKYYLVLYAPITSSSFVCHLPSDDGPCDVAVWQEGNVLVVLLEAQESAPASSPSTRRDDATASASPPLPSSTSTSLLQCACSIGLEIRQLLMRTAAGLTTPVERDAYWISTGNPTRHDAQYCTTPLSNLLVSLANPPILRIQLVGDGVVDGTSLMKVWPGLVERICAIVSSARLNIAASPSNDAAWESWTRWGGIWVYLRYAGPTVTVLAWRSPINMRQLFHDAKRALLLHP